MTNPMIYVPAKVPKDCKFKISPSSFGEFVQRPWNWYRQQVLGLDKFEYNTSSVLGTVVHYVCEQVAKSEQVNEDHIEEYINSHEEKEDFCADDVKNSWVAMAEEIVNGYVIQNMDNYIEVESQVCRKLDSNYYAAGTVDVIQGTKEDAVLVDYKTYNSKTKPKTISVAYKIQLLVYAYLLKKQGINVTRVRLVFVNRYIDGGISEKTNKPLKSYPCETTILTEVITEEDFNYIESMLNLCVDSLEAVDKYKELTHVIFHDPRLKE